MGFNKKVAGWIGSTILPIILINLGMKIYGQERYISIITILMGFLLIYFSYYAFQIKNHEKRIENLEEKMEEKEELLNTIRDIVILRKTK